MFGFRDAEILSEVARAGGFRAAAEARGIAPSAVSARIAQVEKALGVALFDRSRRGARLTPAGRRLLEQADRLLELRDHIAADLQASEGLVGTLRIGVAETIVHTHLPDLLRRLATAAPKIRLELSVDGSEQLARALLEDRIDVAVLMRQWSPRGASATPITRVEMDWFAAPTLLSQYALKAEGETVVLDVKALDSMPVITFLKVTPPGREVQLMLRDPRLRGPVIHGSSSLATMIHLARTGFGVGTLPVRLVEADVAAGRLRRVSFGDEMRLSPLHFELCRLAPSVERLAEILAAGADRPEETADDLRATPEALGRGSNGGP